MEQILGYVVCHEHRTVTAWGCPVCRKERLDAILAAAIEETKRDIVAAFQDKRKVATK